MLHLLLMYFSMVLTVNIIRGRTIPYILNSTMRLCQLFVELGDPGELAFAKSGLFSKSSLKSLLHILIKTFQS